MFLVAGLWTSECVAKHSKKKEKTRGTEKLPEKSTDLTVRTVYAMLASDAGPSGFRTGLSWRECGFERLGSVFDQERPAHCPEY